MRPIEAADKSRAIPLTPRQSPRFGVIAISMTGSFKSAYSIYDMPNGASSGSSIIPSLSPFKPSSEKAHNIPFDS